MTEPQKRRMPTVSFTLTEEIVEYIEAHADLKGRSHLVRRMLEGIISTQQRSGNTGTLKRLTK